jgi:hypothetical protein
MDGYVPLANSISDTPPTIVVQGKQFDSGAQLVVTIDGQDVPIPPVLPTPTTIQGQIPSEFWRNMFQTARVKLVLAGSITPHSGQLLGSVSLPKQRVKFETANGDFRGFHSRHFKQKHSEEYFLSVPTNSTNMVEANLPGRNYLRKGITVTYDGGPFFLDAPPPATGTSASPVQTIQAISQHQTLTLHGLSAGDTVLFPLTANRNQTGNAQPSKIGVLGAQSMPVRQFNLIVHFIASSAPNNACKDKDSHNHDVPNPSLIPARAKQDFSNIVNGINAIWGPQTNVQFTMQLPHNNNASGGFSYSLATFAYDTNHDCTLETSEQSAIYTTIHSSNPNDIDIFVVHAFDASRSQVLGQAQGIGVHGLFVSDKGGADDAFVQILAHEIGHTLGLNHNADGNGHNGTPTTACNQPANPFIDNQNGDSDFTDNSSLMYCFAGPSRRHIGAPLWFQLNQANPVQ